MNLFKSCLGIGVRVSDLEAQPDAKPTSRLIFIFRNVFDGFVFSSNRFSEMFWMGFYFN